ncbi:hypothetical protein DUNSADRAFT_17380 [Dunaliella salina]|uniref:Encoded protein n=1 Tax=Dunaliella salina TaxID=3046 RepID=A0ABQ7G1Y4_DUNSA|nr:hypothetical protein DUNSADRAFT_17380 [Dunaliella salina]|eukprot:KAF5828590.1 hypothetical protein DUNSADRAFT_17380 [Dunaliella salina]
MFCQHPVLGACTNENCGFENPVLNTSGSQHSIELHQSRKTNRQGVIMRSTPTKHAVPTKFAALEMSKQGIGGLRHPCLPPLANL